MVLTFQVTTGRHKNHVNCTVKSQKNDCFLTVCWWNALFDNLSIKYSFLTEFWSNVLYLRFVDQTFFSDNLLIKHSFLTICWSNVFCDCWSNVLFRQFVDKTFFFSDNLLIKLSFLPICWSNVLSDSDVTLELPFTLSHPKPPEETPPPTPVPQQNAPTEEAAGTILREGRVEQTLTV